MKEITIHYMHGDGDLYEEYTFKVKNEFDTRVEVFLDYYMSLGWNGGIEFTHNSYMPYEDEEVVEFMLDNIPGDITTHHQYRCFIHNVSKVDKPDMFLEVTFMCGNSDGVYFKNITISTPPENLSIKNIQDILKFGETLVDNCDGVAIFDINTATKPLGKLFNWSDISNESE